jgi:S1-C subfamily serine protease
MAEELGYKNPVKGVAITAVEPGSDAEKQDLRPGMVITKVDGKEVATVEEFNRLIAAPEAAKGVRLLVTAPSGGWNVVFIEPTKPRGEKTK